MRLLEEAMFATCFMEVQIRGTAILRNQEARCATSAKSIPQDAPTAEIDNRSRSSRLDRPLQDRQPLFWRAQTRGFRPPNGTTQGDPIKSSLLGPAGAELNLPTKLNGRLSRPRSSDNGSIIRECRPPGAAILGLTETPRCRTSRGFKGFPT